MTAHRMLPPIGAFFLVALSSTVAPAQFEGSFGGPRQHVILPPTRGATVLSTYIDSTARLAVATGDFLESAAIARRHNAAAVEHELDNAIKFVETYFRRKEINREKRFGETPLDRMEKRDQVMSRKLLNLPDEVLRGDPTRELNWLLDKLATASLAGDMVAGGDEFGAAPAGHLEPGQIAHIRVTDGGKKGGEKIVFRLDSAEALAPDWPFILRHSNLRPLRTHFENMRAVALEEAKAHGGISYETGMQLKQAVLDLLGAYDHLYPLEERVRSSIDYPQYLVGKRFLESLNLEVLRVLKTNNVQSLDGSYRFAGNNVLDLVQHMARYGMEFAEPEPGDEGTYAYLFRQLREAYSQVLQTQAYATQ